MFEPVATLDDFIQEGKNGDVRMLTTPLRYHAVGIGSVVASGSFDRLRDAYLKAVEQTFVGKCILCNGDVHTQQQFMRQDVGPAKLPRVYHMICEERRQVNHLLGELKVAGIKAKTQSRIIEALKGEHNASSQGSSSQNPSGDIEKYLDGTEGWETAEASHRDSGVVRGQQSEAQASQRPVAFSPVFTKPYNFRVDDALDAPDHEPVTNYKWPPTFRQFVGRIERHNVTCDGPDGCVDRGDESPESKYFGGLFKRDEPGLVPPNDQIGSCCE